MAGKPDIKSMSLQELTEFAGQLSQQPFRARQMYQWMHQKMAGSIDEMTNLSLTFREQLKEACTYVSLQQEAVQASASGGTKKYLFRLSDGNRIESVFMRYKHGNSVCVSSQAGCGMGCRFCASAIGGLSRNLLPSEMLDQIYKIGRDTGERISHVVVMGMGEPLQNYDGLLRFLSLLTDENGLHISQRNITVSTCGIVPKIKKLAEERLQITLAVSLHAASDETRKELMPGAAKYKIREVIDACHYYFELTGRRLTFEYALFEGINDTAKDAYALASLLLDLNCHVNLIPANPVDGCDFSGAKQEAAREFGERLSKYGIHATVRRELGRDIDAACGQLRRRSDPS